MLHPPPPTCDTTPAGGAVGNVRRGEEKRALDMEEEEEEKVGQWSKVSGRENLPKFSLALFHFFSPGDQRPLPKHAEGDYALGWRRMPLSLLPLFLTLVWRFSGGGRGGDGGGGGREWRGNVSVRT